jgi:hypothetical protein
MPVDHATPENRPPSGSVRTLPMRARNRRGLGMLTPFFTKTVTYWFSVPVSMAVAGTLLRFSMWLLGDLLPDDER